MRCPSCRLLYVNPQPDPRAVREFFSSQYIPDDRLLQANFDAWRRDALAREAAFIRQWAPSGRMVDVGCAGGVFLSCFEPGYDRHGIELSTRAVEVARRRFGLTVHQGTLGDAPFAEGTFDLVTILDTFIYLPDPRGDLARVRRLLRPGGCLAIELPGYWWRLVRCHGPLSLALRGGWSTMNPDCFLFFYAPRPFARLLALEGFTLVAVHQENTPARPGRLLSSANRVYMALSRTAARITAGRALLAPKILYVARRDASRP